MTERLIVQPFTSPEFCRVWLFFSALGPTWSRITEEGIPVLAVMHEYSSVIFEDPEISDTVCISPLLPRTKTVQWLIDAPSVTLTNIGITEV